jgi:ribonuclease G
MPEPGIPRGPVSRDILIEGAPGETRIALVEDDLLVELFLERPGDRGVAGNICKGRVSNVLPGMQAAFVNVGLERDAFLYIEDLVGGAAVLEGLGEAEFEGGSTTPEAGRPNDTGPPPAPAPRPRIEGLLRPGQDLVVQITKDPVAQKGVRITTHVSLPGRMLVHLPTVPHCGVSRRIADAAERDRLRGIVEGVAASGDGGGGFIVRTAGEGLEAAVFEKEARELASRWREILRQAETQAAPALLHQEAGVLEKVLRDLLQDDVREVLVEGEEAFRVADARVRAMDPALLPRLRRHEGAPLFVARRIEPQIERALRPRVWLKSGGSIVIHQTEALVAIDVNTGKFVGSRHPEETILRTNLEAAREIVRQIRLRDLGGIIVIDFIDMEEAESRARVAVQLEEDLRRDRSRSRMLQISEFGLVEITRQRTKRSLDRMLTEPCAACQGSGRVRSPETLLLDVARAVRRTPGPRSEPVVIRAHPGVAAHLEGRVAQLEAWTGAPAGAIRIRADASLPNDQFDIGG